MAAKKRAKRRSVGRGTKRHSATAVPVMFRIEKEGNALAVFPTIDEGRGMVQVYAHLGQHSSADMGYVRQNTRPAKPDEYESLKRELEGKPYDYELRVVKRASRKMRSSRS